MNELKEFDCITAQDLWNALEQFTDFEDMKPLLNLKQLKFDNGKLVCVTVYLKEPIDLQTVPENELPKYLKKGVE